VDNVVNSPVLVIAYNRPQLFSLVLSEVIRYTPPMLYIFFDGGKSEDDWVDVCSVREIAKKHLENYSGQFKIYESEENLGCRDSIEYAISWAFTFEEFLIILEDDCLPSQYFFEFVNKGRQRYQGNPLVQMISGRNSLHGLDHNRVMLINGGIWGWGTWCHYWAMRQKKHVSDIELFKNPNVRSFLFRHPFKFMQIRGGSNRIWKGQLDSWDYTWALSRIINGGFTAISPVNLIKNLGARVKPTHSHSVVELIDSEKFKKLDFTTLEFVNFTRPDHRIIRKDMKHKVGSYLKLAYLDLKSLLSFFSSLLLAIILNTFKRIKWKW
jgi:hypothetical protein